MHVSNGPLAGSGLTLQSRVPTAPVPSPPRLKSQGVP